MDKEIYKLALEAIDRQIEDKQHEVYALEDQLLNLKKKREEIRLQTRSELEVFMEKYPWLGDKYGKDYEISQL